MATDTADTNYTSGDDYIVEFLGYRFTFNACDFEQRVVAAAVKLGLVEANELDDEETRDLVALAAQGVIEEPGVAARPLPRAQLGARRARRRRVARLLAAQARLPRRLARPPGQARRARDRLGRESRPSSPTSTRRRPAAARARAGAVVARAAVQRARPGRTGSRSPAHSPRGRSLPPRGRAAGPRGAPTSRLLLAGRPLRLVPRAARARRAHLGAPARRRVRPPPERRAQALGVVCFATIGEVTGSILWGVYRYRLHNLPLFVPPAHGLVYLTGLSLAAALAPRTRGCSWSTAAAAAATWGVLGLCRPAAPRRRRRGRRPAAAALPLALAQPRRLRERLPRRRGARALRHRDRHVAAGRPTLPGLGIPDGNPPSGVASGYVWFDVMALLAAPLSRLALLRTASSASRRSCRPVVASPAP